MKLEKLEKIDKNIVEMEVSVDADEFEKAVDASYRKNIRKMNVPGFRRGKAPRKMVEKMYGKGVFYDDAINEIYPTAYEQAVAEAKITPIDRPEVEEINTENGFSFKVKVTVKPEIEIQNYKGIEIEKMSAKVSKEELDAELKNYQQRQSRLIDVTDRKSQMGDTVIFDFEGFVDGKPFEGGKAEGYSLKLGSGQFIPGFEDQMVDREPESEFSIQVKFPEEYTPELKGKDAEFKIKLHEIKLEQLPELDDDFAKDVSEFDTFAEFKKDVEAKLQKRKDDMAEQDITAKLSAKLADLVEGDIPQCMFDNEVEAQVNGFERRLMSQGISLDKYLEITGKNADSIKAMFSERAKEDVKVRLALEKIAELEHIIVEQADVDAEYDKIAKSMNTEVDKIKSDYITENITKDLSIQKAFECVKNAAVITEEKKAATKKTSTKKAAAEKQPEDAEKKVKPAAKKTTAKKTTTKKATAATEEKKAAPKKTAAKKTTTKKDAE